MFSGVRPKYGFNAASEDQEYADTRPVEQPSTEPVPRDETIEETVEHNDDSFMHSHFN